MIYIQSNKEKTLPDHFDCACALYGAIDSKIDYKLVTFEEVVLGMYDTVVKTNLFVGSVEFMREVFKRIGLINVRLPMNSNRPHELITLIEAKKRSNLGEKLFIKPVELKLFTGLVLDGFIYSSIKDLPDNTIVMAYEPFEYEIESEWRLYVHNDEIVDARNYSGDFYVTPEYDYIESVFLNEIRGKFPKAYTIDIAILYSSENVVVEYNDMWAIGNYGVPNDLYLKLLRERY